MALNYNYIAIGGRVVAEPELRTTSSGTSVCSFRVAVNRPARDGNEQEADFFSVVAWKGTAEFVDRYFRKGSAIFVQGELHSRNFEDSQGQKRTVYEITARTVDFVESKSTAESNYYPTVNKAIENIEVDEDLPF